MNSSDTDSGESVIETTPVKKKPLIFKKVKTKQPETSKVEHTANPDTAKEKLSQNNDPSELDELIRECNILLEGEGWRATPNNPESNEKKTKGEKLRPKNPLAEPIYTTHSKNPHKTHVFYLIEEILKFRPEHTPKNCNMQLVGTVKFHNSSNSHFLYELQDKKEKKKTKSKIKIIIKDCLLKPKEDRRIIAFGMLAFDEDGPYIVVRFFQPFEVPYFTFETIMLKLRTTLPLENMEMTNETEYFPDSFLESEEIDDLVKTVINSDSDKSLKEGDSCTFSDDSQFNDAYWNQVLDDLSFEKLCSEASGGAATSNNIKK